MSNRIRLATGLLLAVMASGAAVGHASATGTSPANRATTASAQILKSGPREGPLYGAECSERATAWTEKTGVFHFCKYKDGSDALAQGWWVWEY
ncbi:hypothetical protein [Streptomyces sp. NPDC056948]|uniref:hypothetical protein n=1 Tax=Streptomyces sp. NPDC056948 TaxID=3345975 RepID=UPI003625D028